MKLLYKIFFPVVWAFMKVFFPFQIIGREKFAKDKKLVVYANHISYMDPIFLAFACGYRRGIYFMAKEELFRNKLFGALIKSLGAFPVKKGEGAKAVENASHLIEENKVFGIFPEGTRSKTGKLGRAKSGIALVIASMKANAQPVAIVTKNQKVRPFRFTRIIVCDEIPYQNISCNTSDAKSLRAAAGKLMEPIAEAVEYYSK